MSFDSWYADYKDGKKIPDTMYEWLREAYREGMLRAAENPESLFRLMGKIDFNECDDFLCLKFGGEGDNGEHLIWLFKEAIRRKAAGEGDD